MKRACDQCGEEFDAVTARRKYCSDRCKQARHRGTDAVIVDHPAVHAEAENVPESSSVASTRAELKAAGRLDTYLGSAAMRLAEKMDQANQLMGYAPLVKEYRATMVEALKGAARQADELDELEERRRQKFASA